MSLPPALLEVKELRRWYRQSGGLFRRGLDVRAVDGVSLSLKEGETLGLVGESGCGKSTLGRAIVRLERPTSGRILLGGEDITAVSGARLRRLRGKFQMIFQDPYGTLDPRMRIGAMFDEALSLHTPLDKAGRRARAVELMEMIGLEPSHLDRHPHQFSGGQRQRIGIGRALAVNPRFIVADEPVSALDVSVQAQIVNLMEDIQAKTGVAFLFIAHDIAVVEHISRRILVMYLGKIVEEGPSAELCAAPSHPYTQALLSSAPTLGAPPRHRIILQGDPPSPAAPPPGCPFHPRCPVSEAICAKEPPPTVSVGTARTATCHFPGRRV